MTQESVRVTECVHYIFKNRLVHLDTLLMSTARTFPPLNYMLNHYQTWVFFSPQFG